MRAAPSDTRQAQRRQEHGWWADVESRGHGVDRASVAYGLGRSAGGRTRARPTITQRALRRHGARRLQDDRRSEERGSSRALASTSPAMASHTACWKASCTRSRSTLCTHRRSMRLAAASGRARTAALHGSACSEKHSRRQSGHRPASARDRVRERDQAPQRQGDPATRSTRQSTVEAAGVRLGRPASTTTTSATRSWSIVDAPGIVYAGGSTGLFASANQGRTWKKLLLELGGVGRDRTRSVARERPLRGDVGARRPEERRRRADLVEAASRHA